MEKKEVSAKLIQGLWWILFVSRPYLLTAHSSYQFSRWHCKETQKNQWTATVNITTKWGCLSACAWLSVSADELKKGAILTRLSRHFPTILRFWGLPEHSRIRSFLFPNYIASKHNAPHPLWRIRYTTQRSWKQHCINWSFYKAK